jgi:hypothetical protein
VQLTSERLPPVLNTYQFHPKRNYVHIMSETTRLKSTVYVGVLRQIKFHISKSTVNFGGVGLVWFGQRDINDFAEVLNTYQFHPKRNYVHIMSETTRLKSTVYVGGLDQKRKVRATTKKAFLFENLNASCILLSARNGRLIWVIL